MTCGSCLLQLVELLTNRCRLLIGAVNKRMSTLDLKFFTNYPGGEDGRSKDSNTIFMHPYAYLFYT